MKVKSFGKINIYYDILGEGKAIFNEPLIHHLKISLFFGCLYFHPKSVNIWFKQFLGRSERDQEI